MRFTSGRIASVDDEIRFIENLVDANKVEYLVTIASQPFSPGVTKVHVMTGGAPLPTVRALLKEALSGVDAMIGSEKPVNR